MPCSHNNLFILRFLLRGKGGGGGGGVGVLSEKVRPAF